MLAWWAHGGGDWWISGRSRSGNAKWLMRHHQDLIVYTFSLNDSLSLPVAVDEFKKWNWVKSGEWQLTAARKTFDWQPVGSLEAWCHQSATRHLTGSAMMSCCCDWYGSKRAVPTQQDFKAGGSIPPWMHPISSDFKADGICLKGIFFSSIPGSSGLVPQLYPSS